MKIEVSISTTGKPSINYRVGEVEGNETPEQIESMRKIAWDTFEKDREQILRTYGKMKRDLGQ